MTKKILKEAEILKDEQLDKISGGIIVRMNPFDDEKYRDPNHLRSSEGKAKLNDLRAFIA